eukprot:8556264-Pyramimonas_sp.AAC.1
MYWAGETHSNCARDWDLQWSSLWGQETLYWVGETHANCAAGTSGGAPYQATKRCNECRRRMRPHGGTKRVR